MASWYATCATGWSTRVLALGVVQSARWHPWEKLFASVAEAQDQQTPALSLLWLSRPHVGRGYYRSGRGSSVTPAWAVAA
jgi:hypothetical protein